MPSDWLIVLWVAVFAVMAGFQVMRYSALVREAKKVGAVPNGIAQANLLQLIRSQLPEGPVLKKVRLFESGSWVAMGCLIFLFAIIAYLRH